jgi:hypothetical protein
MDHCPGANEACFYASSTYIDAWRTHGRSIDERILLRTLQHHLMEKPMHSRIAYAISIEEALSLS